MAYMYQAAVCPAGTLMSTKGGENGHQKQPTVSVTEGKKTVVIFFLIEIELRLFMLVNKIRQLKV